MENDNDPTQPDAQKPKYKPASGADHWSHKKKLERMAQAAAAPAPEPQVTVEQVSADEPPVMDERQEYSAEIERIRKTRKPLGTFTQKLALANRAGYHRHWFNDTPGRIDEAKISGWTHVTDKGQPVKRIVGTGRDHGALWAYAMEIPTVFWEEDMQAQFARAQAPVDAIKASPVQAQRGQSKPQDNEKFYSPRESILDITRK